MTWSLVLGLTLFLGGCASAGTRDPCLLVTRAEAEKVLRAPVGDEKPERGLGGAMVCWYVAPADQSLRVELHPGGVRAYEEYVKAFEWSTRTTARRMPGLGDRAVFLAGQLVALRGEDFLVIALGGAMEETGRLRLSRELARRALSRLAVR